ncbi:MAG: HAD family phosphatase [Flavipsychrobacter sp.]|nr:HAD family phosphatase [Flavipsychrobacter sp.]
MSKGFIFDMNGTMIDDMGYHSIAWGNIINGVLQANLTPDELKLQMYGKNEEVLERIFGKGRFTIDEMNELALQKEHAYQQAYMPHLKLIDGLEAFLKKAGSMSIPMSIGTAAIPFNVDFVLDNLDLKHYFSAVITANDVSESKPHPETFLKCATAMQVPAQDCIVFEDSPKGVEAALNAGMNAVAITTMHVAADFDKYNNVLFCIADYTTPKLQSLFTS